MNFKIEDGTLEEYLGKEKEVVIPKGVEEIMNQAFFDANTVECVIIDNDTKCFLQEFAFEHCYNLKRVYLGRDVEFSKLAEDVGTVFYCCDALERIDVSEENPYYSSENGKLYNKDKTRLLYDPADKYWLEDDEY